MAKSLTATLVGRAVQLGLVDVNAPAPVPEWQVQAGGAGGGGGSGDPRAAITWNQLLRMNSGLWTAGPGNRTDEAYLGGATVVQTAATMPLQYAPATHFNYSNNDIMLAALALSRRLSAGSDPNSAALAFPFTELLWKTGMTRTTPETDWRGDFILSSQVWMTARDLARLALLYENGGCVGAGAAGEQLLPPGWPAYVASGDGVQPVDRRRRAAAANSAAAVELSYFDPARDYQPGLQRARLRGGARVEGLALPLVLTPDAAKQLGQGRLLRLAAARQRRSLHLPWRYLGLRPGDVLHLDGGDWQIREVRFAGFVLSLNLVLVPHGSAPLLAGDPGEALDHGDRPAGPTTLLALDLPPLPGELPDSPRLWLAGAGAGAGWRRAQVMISLDAGASWQPSGSLPGQTIMGTSLNRLRPALGAGWDRLNTVDVELMSDAMWLESRSDLSVLAGANLAVLGDELIQFAAVEAIGQRRFRLSGLLRGRRGTEWATARHQPAERFVLVDPAVMQPLPLPMEMLGQAVLLRAAGVGDADAVPIAMSVGAAGLRPLVPVHLRARRNNGELVASWIAQSRAGFGWPDLGFGGVDSAQGPAGELQSLFQVVLRSAAGIVARSLVTEPAWRCPDHDGQLWLEVTQNGLVPGRTATLIIP